ncbi:MAG: DUF4124 domain-containing protein [Burkholderiales bacterium]
MRNHVPAAGKRCIRALSWCLAAACAAGAWAQGPVCKYVDAAGNIVFSNLPPEKGYRRISCMGAEEPRRSNGGTSRSTPTPAGFPKVDAETQKGRDDMRRKVLADELATEEKLLAEARVLYANGAPVPLPEEQSNAARYQERIARLRQAVQLHERNIEALRKELGVAR